MSNVIQGNFITTLDIPPDKVLAAAQNICLDQVFIIGTSGEYSLYCAASGRSMAENLMLLERAKKLLMEQMK